MAAPGGEASIHGGAAGGFRQVQSRCDQCHLHALLRYHVSPLLIDQQLRGSPIDTETGPLYLSCAVFKFVITIHLMGERPDARPCPQVEAKYPALLFKQQLDAFVQKIFPMLRDNVKKEITSQLAACIHAPRTATTRSRRGGPATSPRASAGPPGVR